ncbi:hypothetical protein BJ085DRAFT_34178 [Dimargaris cristalligena]|uniref:Uncharacterized protein n=1 Tax=Dimargaris cristalligena TaxID=215637 RepID=A0A4P9ZYD8_9FUNG|nr:hypothetical protein BJ085DRAFT_34178 [Dimargaris cristalligena]|eukprot:RKP38734.1 hypothetical protein BJ085DRAFT_34178 [Dimargaris cristalligena]
MPCTICYELLGQAPSESLTNPHYKDRPVSAVCATNFTPCRINFLFHDWDEVGLYVRNMGNEDEDHEDGPTTADILQTKDRCIALLKERCDKIQNDAKENTDQYNAFLKELKVREQKLQRRCKTLESGNAKLTALHTISQALQASERFKTDDILKECSTMDREDLVQTLLGFKSIVDEFVVQLQESQRKQMAAEEHAKGTREQLELFKSRTRSQKNQFDLLKQQYELLRSKQNQPTSAFLPSRSTPSSNVWSARRHQEGLQSRLSASPSLQPMLELNPLKAGTSPQDDSTAASLPPHSLAVGGGTIGGGHNPFAVRGTLGTGGGGTVPLRQAALPPPPPSPSPPPLSLSMTMSVSPPPPAIRGHHQFNSKHRPTFSYSDHRRTSSHSLPRPTTTTSPVASGTSHDPIEVPETETGTGMKSAPITPSVPFDSPLLSVAHNARKRPSIPAFGGGAAKVHMLTKRSRTHDLVLFDGMGGTKVGSAIDRHLAAATAHSRTGPGGKMRAASTPLGRGVGSGTTTTNATSRLGMGNPPPSAPKQMTLADLLPMV